MSVHPTAKKKKEEKRPRQHTAFQDAPVVFIFISFFSPPVPKEVTPTCAAAAAASLASVTDWRCYSQNRRDG